ncbi:hypothetical protein MMC08_007894 [Hypocenomyce scalaris]|nr:hypothetical protein [Hypocenomyce scalaris]
MTHQVQTFREIPRRSTHCGWNTFEVGEESSEWYMEWIGDVKYDNLRETVREIIKRERPPGIFEVHMETRTELQSEEEVEADL